VIPADQSNNVASIVRFAGPIGEFGGFEALPQTQTADGTPRTAKTMATPRRSRTIANLE